MGAKLTEANGGADEGAPLLESLLRQKILLKVAIGTTHESQSFDFELKGSGMRIPESHARELIEGSAQRS